ncbi:hypothetical protein SERLA73DRAFT_72588 [Serpula lacrymans var. lacrymans S7.3]|uniref:non-specific serine/threonine protein kinase n=2 Tax=Serpula lacrymans var. lacrymans TaxID=341189 RepID=F8PVI2_SERL3|nr:hypothetical protein SERLA73DRAFT_72588 [Serpula lacrymans var. lacrymans S7.3]
MINIQTSRLTAEPSFPPTLADLSRNASVISSSSDSESTPSLLLKTPRPRPIRTFSSPRSRSPQSPTPIVSRPPAYLTKDLGFSNGTLNAEAELTEAQRVAIKARSKSRNRSASKTRNHSVSRICAEDFEFGETLGEGSYSEVKRATHRGSGQQYAIKILDKGHLKRKQKLPVALAEKNTLVKLGAGHPGIVHLHWTFQDEWSLFFVLDLATNGEMQTCISRLGSLSTTCARYYAAQIVDAVEYMHSKDVIHRDLKPENLLLDDAFRIKLTDFGTGKLLEPSVDRAKSFVGTAQYVSPELLESGETSKSSDLWSLGCIIYQMIAGRFAFQGLSEYYTWQKIKQLDYSFPDGFDEEAKDIVQKLLVRDPSARLGVGAPGSVNDRQALRSHPFFATINWSTLWTDPAPPPEAGLVKKDLPIARGDDQNWEEVGSTWDALVGNSMQGEDELQWAHDGEGTEYEIYKQNSGQNGHVVNGHDFAEEVGPTGEVPQYAQTLMVPKQMSSGEGDTATITSNGITETCTSTGGPHTLTVPIPVPDAGTGSGTSSSDGSPIEKLGAALEAMVMNRGRNRVQTPVQGNGFSNDWQASLTRISLPPYTI